MSHLGWTTKSLAHPVEALARMGHAIEKSALAKPLDEQGFSLKANEKNIEGTSHPDRDEQFRHIDERCKAFEELGDPIISVGCKKKEEESLGDFENGGREWQAKGKNTTVNVHDHRSLSTGKAVPYGVCDLVHDKGFSSTSGSTTTRPNSPWRASDGGGEASATSRIRRLGTFRSVPMVGAVMARAISSSNANRDAFAMRAAWR